MHHRPGLDGRSGKAATASSVGIAIDASDLYDYGKDHRPSTRAVVDELAQAVVQVLLDELDLGHVLVQELLQDALGLDAHLVEQRLGLAEPARDQLRRARDLAVRPAERRDDDQDAVLGQVAAVAERDVVDVADAEPVHEGDAGLDVTGQVGARLVELDHGAVLGKHDPVLRHAALGGQPRVSGEHAELAVHGHDRLRPHEPEPATPGRRQAALRHAADRVETALAGLEVPLGRYLLELEADQAEGRSWYGAPGAAELLEWQPILDRAGVRVSHIRVAQAYLELAVFVRALQGLADAARIRATPDRSSLWAGLFDLRENLLGRTLDDLRALAA